MIENSGRMFKILRENDFPLRSLYTAKSPMICEGRNKNTLICMQSEGLATMVLSKKFFLGYTSRKRRDKPRKSKMPPKSSSYSEGQ